MSGDRFAGGALYDLLPAVVRHRDSQIDGQPLKTVLAEFGKQIDLLERKIEESNANFFVETCGPEALPYIADLIGYRPILAPQPEKARRAGTGQPKVTPDDPDKPPRLNLRRDVAKTIWARRRKGMPDVLGAIVRSITGWHAVVFENNREIVATPSARFAGAPRSQGTPDVRKLVGRSRMDQGPGLIPRIATVRRIDNNGARGRWHPLDVVVEACSQRAVLHEAASLHNSGKGSFLTLCPDGNSLRLYAPADESADATRMIESARGIYLSDFEGEAGASVQQQIYGKDRALCLYQPDPAAAEKLVEVAESLVTFGSVPDHAGNRWIIDPGHGHVQPPSGNNGPVVLRCYVACNSAVDLKVEEAVRVRLKEHVPMEARAGVIRRA